MSVFLVDPGVARERLLAGELLQPAGVDDLRALGLSAALEGALPVRGFAVRFARAANGEATALLPYDPPDEGASFEHAAFTRSLWDQAAQQPGISLIAGARVSGVLRNDARGVTVSLSGPAGQRRVSARLLVAADGRGSHVRAQLGIPDAHEPLSTMLGVTVPREALAHPGFGHLFVSPGALALAYATTERHARVMIDLPRGTRPDGLADDVRLVEVFPPALREAVREAARRERPLAASNDSRLPARVCLGSAVLIGDAAGCCHPVSASGIASGLRDARVLADALRASSGDVSTALARYVRLRRGGQQTRLTLAAALYRAFTEQSPEMEALRGGLLRSWRAQGKGARRGVALLSGRETRPWALAREYLRVVGEGLSAIYVDRLPLPHRGRVARGLLASSWVPLESALHAGTRSRAVEERS